MKTQAWGIFLLSLVFLFLTALPVCGAKPASPIDYALADGTRLTAYLSLPRGYQKGKKYPAILLIHGGKGDGKDPLSRADGVLKTKPVQERFCPHYVVFAAAYHMDYFGGPRELESLAAALKTLAALPQVDPTRIAALGVSHGGYLALMCAVHPEIPKIIKAAVSISGVVDVGAFLQHRSGGTSMAASPVGRALGWPPDKDAGARGNYARVSLHTYLGNLQAPVLVIHGDRDNLVPVSQARGLRESLEKRHKVFEFLEVPTGKIGGHFIFLTSKAVWEKIDAFLKKYL